MIWVWVTDVRVVGSLYRSSVRAVSSSKIVNGGYSPKAHANPRSMSALGYNRALDLVASCLQPSELVWTLDWEQYEVAHMLRMLWNRRWILCAVMSSNYGERDIAQRIKKVLWWLTGWISTWPQWVSYRYSVFGTLECRLMLILRGLLAGPLSVMACSTI